MKLTLNELLGVQGAFGKLASAPLKATVAFKVVQMIKEVQKSIESLEETRKKLVGQYSVKDEAGKTEIPQERMAEFQKEFGVLLGTEVEVTDCQIALSEISTVELTARDIMALEKLIVNDIKQKSEAKSVMPKPMTPPTT